MVSNAALVDGGDIMARHAQRQLAITLADFMIGSKFFEDRGACEMRERQDMDATEFTVRGFVLTQKEIEKLVTDAFAAGQQNMELPRPKFGPPPWAQEKVPYDPPPPPFPSPGAEWMKRMIEEKEKEMRAKLEEKYGKNYPKGKNQF